MVENSSAYKPFNRQTHVKCEIGNWPANPGEEITGQDVEQPIGFIQIAIALAAECNFRIFEREFTQLLRLLRHAVCANYGAKLTIVVVVYKLVWQRNEARYLHFICTSNNNFCVPLPIQRIQ